MSTAEYPAGRTCFALAFIYAPSRRDPLVYPIPAAGTPSGDHGLLN